MTASEVNSNMWIDHTLFFQKYFAIVVDVLCSLVQLTYRMYSYLSDLC